MTIGVASIVCLRTSDCGVTTVLVFSTCALVVEGFSTVGENIGFNNLSIFKTTGKLTIDDTKAHCDPKWSDSSTNQDVQFCIQSNMMFVFIKNSITQPVLDYVKDEKAKWMRPGGGDGASLLIRIYNKNDHGT